MERVLVALGSRGYCLTRTAQGELADKGQRMTVDEIVEFVLMAEGFSDTAYVDKHQRAELRADISDALEPS